MKPVQILSFMSIGTTDVEFKEKKKTKKLGKIIRLAVICEIFHTQFCFAIFYAVKSSEIKTESKN